MPIPIQLGPMSDRLRKFFRLRGKTSFMLDEVVAPVVLVQDLTIGPYQAGVTPCAATIRWQVDASPIISALVIVLNDKAGSPTPVLGDQFEGRSFSVTEIALQNASQQLFSDLRVKVASRQQALNGLVSVAASFASIQNNPGNVTVPVELFGFDAGVGTGGLSIWRGILGALGVTPSENELSMRNILPQPNMTIGPNDALILENFTPGTGGNDAIFISVRGFYQQQPA